MENEQLIGRSCDYLRECVKQITHRRLREATQVILDDPEFIKCPAARNQHQAYIGGLVVHTAEVMRTSLAMASSPHLDVDLQVLIPAVVWHDYGKIYDYTVKLVEGSKKSYACCPGHGPVIKDEDKVVAEVIEYTPHQGLIRHLSRSYAMFMAAVHGNLKDETVDKIGHCILAHHGRKEWGSPVEPIMTEAHILHFADCMSAFCAKKTYELPDAK